jgi:hypothetical protein
MLPRPLCYPAGVQSERLVKNLATKSKNPVR